MSNLFVKYYVKGSQSIGSLRDTHKYVIDHHADNYFTNRALPCIATASGDVYIKDCNGKQKAKLPTDFNQVESASLEDSDDVVTEVTKRVCEQAYRIKEYLKMEGEGIAVQL